jgi:3D (Asp-Asp-Asp) domain-containing protein
MRARTIRVLAAMLLLAPTATAQARTCAPVWLTGYSDKGTTANGDYPRPGDTAAASENVPLGTTVWIAGLGSRLVNDRGALYVPHEGHWVWLDLATWTDAEAYRLTGSWTACW